jgi:hypothetical protein
MKVDAVQCDNPECRALVLAEQATEVETRYKGPKVNGRKTEHLCPDCVDQSVKDTSSLKPLTGVRTSPKGKVPESVSAPT